MSQRPPDPFVLDPDEEHVTGPDGNRYSIVRTIDQLPWRTALPGGGMPVHQYIVIGPSTLPAADVLASAIRDHHASFDAYFRGYQRPMRYLELGDLRYWRTSLGGTHMVNRCTLDSVEPPRRVTDGAKPIPWDGPPWAPNGSPWPPGYVEVGPNRWVYRAAADPRRGYVCTSCRRAYWRSAPERPCPKCGQVP